MLKKRKKKKICCKTTGAQNTNPSALHGFSLSQEQLPMFRRRKKHHMCQTTQIKMLIVKIKSLVVGPRVLPWYPKKKIFPNDKCEPTDHRCWKMEWYTLNNEYLKLWSALLPWAVQNQAVESALLQTKRIYLSIRCDNFFFRMKSSQPACSQAHAPPRHFESVPNASTADHYFKKKREKGDRVLFLYDPFC